MRTKLLASCCLALSFGVVGCDDPAKKDATPETAAPAVTPAAPEPGKGAMEAAPKGAMEAAPKGKMEGAMEAPAATPPATPPAEAPKPEEKKEEMPK